MALGAVRRGIPRVAPASTPHRTVARRRCIPTLRLVPTLLLVWAALGACHAAAPASPAAARPTVEPTAAPADVAPDLRNATLPDPCTGGGRTVRLVDGVATYPSPFDPSAEGELEVEPVGEADLDGDGTIELVAHLHCMPGGSGQADSVRAYHVEAGAYVEIAAIPGGDRAAGGLESARIEAGSIVVERASGDAEGLCCPTHVSRETWSFEGATFVRTSAAPPRPIDPG